MHRFIYCRHDTYCVDCTNHLCFYYYLLGFFFALLEPEVFLLHTFMRSSFLYEVKRLQALSGKKPQQITIEA